MRHPAKPSWRRPRFSGASSGCAPCRQVPIGRHAKAGMDATTRGYPRRGAGGAVQGSAAGGFLPMGRRSPRTRAGTRGRSGGPRATPRTSRPHARSVRTSRGLCGTARPRSGPSSSTRRETASPCQPVRHDREVLSDPQALPDGYIVEKEIPFAGRHRLVSNPVQLSRTPAAASSVFSELGEHTESIMQELGSSPDEIATVEGQRRRGRPDEQPLGEAPSNRGGCWLGREQEQ